MRILIITSMKGAWPYVPELMAHAGRHGHELRVLDIDTMRLADASGRGPDLIPDFSRKIALSKGIARAAYKYLALRRAIDEAAKQSWDAVNVHFILPMYAFVRRRLRRAGRSLVLTYWGSDYLRADKTNLLIQSFIHPMADAITFNNPAIIESFKASFPAAAGRTRLLRFGFGSLDVLEALPPDAKAEARRRFRVDESAVCVAVGYNANKAQDHLAIIDELASLSTSEKAKVFLIIPATYPEAPEYAEEIRRRIDAIGLKGSVIEERLSERDLCLLRLAADIMVNLQRTDSFSASIQEYAYAGAAMVVGSWLPYGVLEAAGVKLIKVEDTRGAALAVSELLRTGTDGWRNGDEARSGIRALSGWEENIGSWLRLYAEGSESSIL